LKIKGIAGKKHKFLKKGDAIPLSPEEKACFVASDVVVNMSTEVLKNIPISKEVVGEVKVIKGRDGIKNPEPDKYQAIVKVSYKKLDMVRDKLFGTKNLTLKVLFEDSKDDLGLPDLKAIKDEIL
jgi:hypothetical protein